MIHQYKNNGYNIVMDVCSGAVHVVDDVVYDAVAVYDKEGKEAVSGALSGKYPEEEVKEALEEIEELKSEGLRLTEDIYEQDVKDFKSRKANR